MEQARTSSPTQAGTVRCSREPSQARPAGSAPRHTTTTSRTMKRKQRVELQVESMSGFAVRLFLYTWYAVLLFGLIVQAYNVDIQWEAREFCGADHVSLDLLTSWNSSRCVERQKYLAPAEAHFSLAPPWDAATTVRHASSQASSHAFYWVEAPPLAELFPPLAHTARLSTSSSPACPGSDKGEEDEENENCVSAQRMMAPNTTTASPRPTMRPLVPRYAVRWTSAKTFARLLDHHVNRFAHVLLSLASPMENITKPRRHDDKASVPPRYRYYSLRVAMEEEPFDPTANDTSSSSSSSSHEASESSQEEEQERQSTDSQYSSSSSSSSSSSNETGDSSSSSGGDEPARWHYVFNATIICYVDRPRCSTLVLPRSVAVMTTNNVSRFSLTLLDVAPELALASANPSAVAVWYQRGAYTIGTLVWRCVFLVYSLLSGCRFAYRSRLARANANVAIAKASECEPGGDFSRPHDKASHHASRRTYEQYAIWILLLSFLCYLDPVFVPGVYQWSGLPVSVYHFLEFHFPNYFLATLLCFCFTTCLACGQSPQLAPATTAAVVDEERPPPPFWVHLISSFYVTVVLILDVSQGFFEDWEWGTEAVCDTSLCRGLRVGLNVTLLTGFVVVLVSLFWLRHRLGTLPYLETRPQQLIGRLLIFILFSSVLYLVIITVMMAVLHAQILDLVYFQPLTQLGPMVVVTALVNHLTYIFTPIAASSRVPIRPNNPLWKRVRWSSRWFRWLDLHGGSLYVFATEAEERDFIVVQRQRVPPSSSSSWLPGRHGRHRAASGNDGEGNHHRTTSTASAPPAPEQPHMDDDDAAANPYTTRTQSENQLGTAAARTAPASRRLSRVASSLPPSTPALSVSSRTSSASSSASSASRSNGTSPFPSPAMALALGLPPDASGGESVTATRSRRTSRSRRARRAPHAPAGGAPLPSSPTQSHSQTQRSGDANHDDESDGARWRPGARFSSHSASQRVGTAGVLSFLHGAEHTLVDGTGLLMDVLEDALLERPLHAVLHRGRHGGGGGTSGASSSAAKAAARVEARRHYFFNIETAVDCFNMAWEAYAVTASRGDALIETGLTVDPLAAPDAVVGWVERFFRWLFIRLFAWKQDYDARELARAQERANSVTVAVDGPEVTTDTNDSPPTLSSPARQEASGSGGAAGDGDEEQTPITASTPDPRADTLPRPLPDRPSASPTAPLTAPLDTRLDPTRYGHVQLAQFEMAGVQVIVTALDQRAAVHAGKTPRLLVSFRGTDNIANALQDIRFHQRAWREMPGRLLSVRPTVHSGFLEMWMQLKERVLTAVLDALRQQYIFEPFRSAPSAAPTRGTPSSPPQGGSGLPTWRLRQNDDGNETPHQQVHAPDSDVEFLAREGPSAFADVFVTGHSLGGALACLCAYSLHRALSLVHYPRADVCVYTFGQPRLGNTSFRDAYNRAVPHTFRVVNESDAVSGWRIGSGHHVGVQVNIDRHGNYVCKPMALERLLRPTAGPGLAVLNHSMLAYADSLNAVAERLQQQSQQRRTRINTSVGASPPEEPTEDTEEEEGERVPPLRCLVTCASLSNPL